MPTFRKGLVLPQSQQNTPTAKPIGRVHQPAQPTPAPELPPVTPREEAPTLLGADGMPLDYQPPEFNEDGRRRGLVSSAGLPVGTAAEPEKPEAICPRCGEWRERSNMRLLMQGTDLTKQGGVRTASGFIVMCLRCVQQSYKDPHNSAQRWSPIPEYVRFNEQGNPYDAGRMTGAAHAAVDVYYKDEAKAPKQVESTNLPAVPQRIGRIRST